MRLQNKYLYLITGLFLGAVSILILNFVMTKNDSIITVDNVKNSEANVIDAHFIEQMIPHHEDAITMSELALEKAQRSEVKELAQNIISSQTEEINQMNEWYRNWFNRELPTGDQVMKNHGMISGSDLHMGMMGSDMDISNLENSEDFDRAFVEGMIPHHQMAVMMASMLKNGTTKPEMKKLADEIITAQTEEIELMRKWLTEWN